MQPPYTNKHTLQHHNREIILTYKQLQALKRIKQVIELEFSRQVKHILSIRSFFFRIRQMLNS